MNNYFRQQKKKAKSEDQAGYFGLAQKIVLKMLPQGDVQNPNHSFVELGDFFRKELETQFGNPNRPILTASQRINYIQKIFKRELPNMASTKAISESLSESPYSVRHRREYTKQMQAALTKALVAMFVDQARAYILEKSLTKAKQGSLFEKPAKVLGHTETGKAVDNRQLTPESFVEKHKDWSRADHEDASNIHYKLASTDSRFRKDPKTSIFRVLNPKKRRFHGCMSRVHNAFSRVSSINPESLNKYERNLGIQYLKEAQG